MAVRIPTYTRHVQLDAAAQTIPRYPVADIGKGLSQAGTSMIQVAAHWRQKQDQFDRMQMHQNDALLKQKISQIIEEESRNWDATKDRPGSLHDRIQQRVSEEVTKFKTQAPRSLVREYDVLGNTAYEGSSTAASVTENKLSNHQITGKVDAMVGQIIKQAQANPDGWQKYHDQIKSTIAEYDKLGNLTTTQKRIMLEGYEKGLGKSVYTGFVAQGRQTEAQEFVKGWSAARDAEQPPGVDPAGRPSGGGAGPRTEGGEVNQRRVAQIDAKPEVKAAIEKAADATGMDPNVLKVYASIESSGNPRAQTGSYGGLFQLSKSEFGMNGGGDIYNAEDNAMAAAKMLAARSAELEQKLGHTPSASELYLAHQQGMGGVVAHLQNPDQPAWQSMLSTAEGQQKGEAWAKKAIWGNIPDDLKARFGRVENVTSADLYNIYDSKVRGGKINLEQAPPVAAGPQRTVTASVNGTVTDAGPPSVAGGIELEHGPRMPLPPTRAVPVEEGNIDLSKRPVVRNADGSISTIKSASFTDDQGKQVLVPTISDDGRQLTDEEAKQQYRDTGKHLGKFNTPEEATTYAERLSAAQGVQYGAQNQPLSRWKQWEQGALADIDAQNMKAQSINTAMKHKLTSVLQSDVNSLAATGQPVTLSKDLQDYFHTKELTFDFVSNKLGTGAAISWQEGRELSQRVYGATADMSQMPAVAVQERLKSLQPQAGAPDYDRQVKVFNAAVKSWQTINKEREVDPAAAADKMPDVQAALEKAMKNPGDANAIQELVTARMKAQDYLQIPKEVQSPITNAQARQFGTIVRDPNKTPMENAEILNANIIKFVGNAPDLQAQAVAKILNIKGITQAQRTATADALRAINERVPEPPIKTTQPAPTRDTSQSAYGSKDGYLGIGAEGMGYDPYGVPNQPWHPGMYPPDNYADNPSVGFTPGSTFIAPKHIDALRKDPSLATMFDNGDPNTGFQGYGAGAAQWVLDQAKGGGATTPVTPSAPIDAQQPAAPAEPSFPSGIGSYGDEFIQEDAGTSPEAE